MLSRVLISFFTSTTCTNFCYYFGYRDAFGVSLLSAYLYVFVVHLTCHKIAQSYNREGKGGAPIDEEKKSTVL